MKKIIIGTLIKDSDHTYKSKLLINNDSELILDHLSGFHIPSMVLIESARQATEGVVNKFLSTFEKTYITVVNINRSFIHFVFSIEIDLNIIVKDLVYKKNSVSLINKVELIQNNRICSTIELNVKFFEEDLLLAKEEYFAKKAVKYIIKCTR